MTRRTIRKRLLRTAKVLRPWMLPVAKLAARHWPIAAAAAGGMLVQRLWSRRSLQRAMTRAAPSVEDRPTFTPPVQGSEMADSVEAWTPTAPNLSPPAF